MKTTLQLAGLTLSLSSLFAAGPLAFDVSRALADEDGTSTEESAAPVSYYREVRPVFQARCHGCHQPAKAQGEYVMTTVERLLRGGESEEAAIVPHKPDDSNLVALITPDAKGLFEMPRGKNPEALSAAEIELIRRWIAEGAKDDTPSNVRQKFTAENPPTYSRPPVVSSLDYSPDGQLLAITGFHEVFLHQAEGGGLVARLVGLSERVESVAFSPDGKKLAVTGGLPARMGELQIWDLEKRALELSVPVTFDSTYGVSWSPDGKLVALGCADNSLRVFDVATGNQVVYMAAHDNWVRGTVFSADGKSIFTASRDKTVKMTDLATQRFVGNITTHTPGVLRGGMNAIRRHPTRNELLVGGADGAPKLFKMDVTAAPAGGGNPNQIREYGQLPGRLFDVCFQAGGARFFAASSLDGTGQVRAFETDSGKELWKLDVAESGIFCLACSPDGKTVAAAGADGLVRLLDAETGSLRHSFVPVEVKASSMDDQSILAAKLDTPALAKTDALPRGFQLQGLTAETARIEIGRPTDYAQLLLTAKLSDDAQADVTRMATWSVEGELGSVSPRGVFTPQKNGSGNLVGEVQGQQVVIPVVISGLQDVFQPDFIRDVNPVISKLGCNAGTCHGSKDGKNGFKLSLRGYDALFDVRGFTDDMASRRANVAVADKSLMLLKATGAVPHEGGQVTKQGSKYYQIIRSWIAGGARLDLNTPRIADIEILPKNPVVQRLGGTQQMRIVATYEDGSKRDVTLESHISSGNTEVATHDTLGLLTAIRRGETPVLARYEGRYAATTLTVMGDRTGFAWQQPPANNEIDALVANKWRRMKILPSQLCSDEDFIRRVYLDLNGLAPTPEVVSAFLNDTRPTNLKREEVIERLVGGEEFIEHWTNKWADLLQVNRKFLGVQGSKPFRDWIRDEINNNTPYDEFVRKILTASGSNKTNPAASYYKILREPDVTMENTTHLFLATRFNCNKCHDHPFERWTQDQYYQMAAYFSQFQLKKDPASGKDQIGGTAVESGKPLYEIVEDTNQGEVKHERTGAITAPHFPYEVKFDAVENASRREQLAAWITSPDNPYFARSYVNRLWGYLLGMGIIDPIDDIRAGNPPTNPELLDWLTREFVESGFDVRHLIKLICRSRVYQLSVETNRWNEDDALNFSHFTPRRLPAEVLLDSIYQVTGSQSKFPGVPAGTRAAELPDAGVRLPDGFLGNFGRPARESACECERSNNLQLGPVMALMSGPTVNDAISDPQNAIAKLARAEMEDQALVEQLFMRILNRPPRPHETEAALKALRNDVDVDHQSLAKALADYEQQLAPELLAKEKARQERIEASQAELEAYRNQIAEREQELDRKHQALLDQSRENLANFDKQLPRKMAEWEQKLQQGNSGWTVLSPQNLLASNEAKLELQDDLSVFVSGKNGKTTYEFLADTPLEGITGIRLELLADPRLPKNGPGRAPNGNFVLTELELTASPRQDLASWQTVQEWDAAAVQAAWKSEKETALKIEGDALQISGEAASIAAAITSPSGSFVLEVTAQAEPAKPAHLYWATKGEQDYTDKRRAGPLEIAAGSWQTYRFAFVSAEELAGLRLDAGGGLLSIKSIKLYRHDAPKPVSLQNAKADFSQAGYDVTTAIDGKAPETSNGWATSPQTGVNRVASFETKEDVSYKGGSTLRFVLNQQHSDGAHSIGRFRLSITRQPRPLSFGAPGEIQQILAVAAGERNAEQQAKLAQYFQANDPGRRELVKQVAEAEKPRPIDPKLKQLQDQLAKASEPVPQTDPKLDQLRRDFEISKKQLQEKRVVAAQDIAWALINSPSFLFNR